MTERHGLCAEQTQAKCGLLPWIESEARFDNAKVSHAVIHIHPAAPAKPAEGQACNGCGVCCIAEPCPIGMLISRKRTGMCDALEWNEAQERYSCGLVSNTARYVPLRRLEPLVSRLALRFIASGKGCDCDLDVQPVEN